jgi:hypothetical protein
MENVEIKAKIAQKVGDKCQNIDDFCLFSKNKNAVLICYPLSAIGSGLLFGRRPFLNASLTN